MNNKDRAIQAGIDRLRINIEQAQQALHKELELFVSGFDTRAGILENNEENITLAQEADSVFDRASEAMLLAIADIVASIRELKKYSVDYFDELGYESDIDELGFLDTGFGFTDDGIVDDGYFHSLVLMEDVRADVRLMVLSAVMGGRPLASLLGDIENYIIGGERQGAIQSFMRSHNIEDIFKQSLCYADKYFADRHALQKFRYVGGLVEQSRDFCIERDGHEFWRYQGEEWDNLDWAGKIDGIDFFVQVGGWNCRHYLEWF